MKSRRPLKPSPVRSRTRTTVLFWLAAVAGVVMFAAQQILMATGVIESTVPGGDGLGGVRFGVDLSLGVLALALLPSAIRHDPMEVEESYVGPPSALVACLVILCVWLVSVLAAPAGAVVLISLSARLSANWTVPAVFASLLSIIVHELTYYPARASIDPPVVAGALLLTLLLILMGSVRGLVLRRQAHEAEVRTQPQPVRTSGADRPDQP
ncbi:hypothetical protein BRM1_08560 [Brevibacterium sp. BRM-1]|uniref:hypothetical protein n=1 Tax=Brevibacterium sp. BRM-1 TaxID=2999062 RepID=UPI00227E728E|nr:hypothetical protein [Brevibacterium sp. BRM-1]WAL39336.1 hypothetical protein BRM1_08560 [Brevibacterium sp. BRM-1]